MSSSTFNVREVMRVIAIILGIILIGTGYVCSMGLVEILSSLISWYRPDRLKLNFFWHPEASNRREKGKPSLGILLVLLLVLVIFAISLGLLWALLHVGPPIQTGVRFLIKYAHGNVLIILTTLFACFFVSSAITFLGMRIFSKKF
jgi:hypothetical protein